MNILHFNSDRLNEYNSGRWRIANMADELRRRGHQIRVLSVNDWMEQTALGRLSCNWADIIIVHRVIVQQGSALAHEWRGRGKIVVAEWDDGYEHVEHTNPAFTFWIEGKSNLTTKSGMEVAVDSGYSPTEDFRQALTSFSAATVPSKILAQDYARQTNCFYLPNYIDYELYAPHANKWRDDEKLVIGWGGSLGHVQSFERSGAAEALRQVLQKYHRVYLMIVGDDRIMKHLHVPERKVMFHPYVHYTGWPRKQSLFDIMIAPLEGEFDKRRSFLKGVEATVMQRPLVATGDSEYPVYAEFFDHPAHIYVGHGGDKRQRIHEWANALCAIIDDYDDKKQLAIANANYGEQFWAENNIDGIIDLYETIGRLS